MTENECIVPNNQVLDDNTKETIAKAIQEAIERLEEDSCYECAYGCESAALCDAEDCGLKNAVKMAIKALEEIQAYKALGTVEEIQKAIENLPLHQVEHKLLQEYQTIGTVRECKIAVERMKGGGADA